ncbi:MAG: Rrf2 family transcriptional regulator [Planctomycetota bacterium]
MPQIAAGMRRGGWGLHQHTLATIQGIAEAYDISRNHVIKVVHRLAQHGFLKTYRGRGGGLELARVPERIRVGEVVRAVEAMTLVECFEAPSSRCRIVAACELKGALLRAREAFLGTLDDDTLADLLGPERKLGRALGVTAGD